MKSSKKYEKEGGSFVFKIGEYVPYTEGKVLKSIAREYNMKLLNESKLGNY